MTPVIRKSTEVMATNNAFSFYPALNLPTPLISHGNQANHLGS
jgi:hypothetical protein